MSPIFFLFLIGIFALISLLSTPA